MKIYKHLNPRDYSKSNILKKLYINEPSKNYKL